ncbi:MAG: competence/damage-inducible protein A [Chthonomonas sp.]|nr:competence/damage-inducible protein A [Chthonomonas sp.]
MRAEIISVGTEILLGQIVDTNAAELGVMLAELGIAHTHRQTVGDNRERLVEALRLALSRSDVVFTIGGLGPTLDDLTRDGIADALGETMIVDEDSLAILREIFASRRLTWTEAQVRQAMRPPCAEVIANPVGTAPGLICRKDGKTVIAMPGPKFEFVPMLRGRVREALLELSPNGAVSLSRTLRIVGLGESIVEKNLGELMNSANPTVAPYAKTAEVHLRVTSFGNSQSEVEAAINPMVKNVRAILGEAVYGEDEETLEETVINLLVDKGASLAVCESCTGGLLGSRLTSVPGSSAAFAGGFVTYTNELKHQLAGVPLTLLESHGAVSEECARAMAEGTRERLKTDYAISITGIAGPSGGTDAKPVGLVFLALASAEGTIVRELRLRGARNTVRERSAHAALNLVRLALLGHAN